MSFGEFADVMKLSRLRRSGFEMDVWLTDGPFNFHTEREWRDRLRSYDSAHRMRRNGK